MAYFTYRIFKDVTLDRLERKVEANLALYESGTVGRQITIELAQGLGCSSMVFDGVNHEDNVFLPIGYQLGCLWMDVRFQDHDSWDLSIYHGPEHKVSHDVNPWAHEEGFEYRQDHIDYRIDRVCELWPERAELIRLYLLPWRERVGREGRARFVERRGKAYDRDEHDYGDAYQIYDFVRAFGLRPPSSRVTIGPAA